MSTAMNLLRLAIAIAIAIFQQTSISGSMISMARIYLDYESANTMISYGYVERAKERQCHRPIRRLARSLECFIKSSCYP